MLQQATQEYTAANKQLESQKALQIDVQTKEISLREKVGLKETTLKAVLQQMRNFRTYQRKVKRDYQSLKEKIYNADYQIQLLERKLTRANGARTLEETDFILGKLKRVKDKHVVVKTKFQLTQQAVQGLKEEHRHLDRRIKEISTQMELSIKGIERVQMEIDLLLQEQQSLKNSKEQIQLQNNTMKLDIIKLQQRVVVSYNDVALLQETKIQSSEAALARKAEIQMRIKTLRFQIREIERQKSQVQNELTERQVVCKNLEIKFGNLQSQKQGHDGHERTQAYYIIKNCQEKEELERKIDALNGEIKTALRDLQSLKNVFQNQKRVNEQIKNNHLLQKSSAEEVRLYQSLSDQLMALKGMVKERKEEEETLMHQAG